MIVEKIKDNLFVIRDDLVDQEKLKRYIIDEKIKRVNQDFNFTLSDLVLVRSVREDMFPLNGFYYPLSESTGYKSTLNPFGYLFSSIKFGYDYNYLHKDLSDYKEEDTNLYHSIYRDTKHFTINHLSSNANGFFIPVTTFNNRPFIIIEPMQEHINNGLLVNLNPIDTFFNLHNTSMRVSNNAIFLINEKVYLEVIKRDDFKNLLSNHKVFLFNEVPSIATDIVLLNLGILPIHSVGQRELIEESYLDGIKEISDKDYLKLFTDYIEYLNKYYLNSSYYNLPPDIMNSRIEYEHKYPGILHDNTHFRDEEILFTKKYIMKTYDEYMHLLATFGDDVFKANVDNMINLINSDVEEKYPLIRFTFFALHQQYEKMMSIYLEAVGYDKFMQLTNDFNSKQKAKVNKRRIG